MRLIPICEDPKLSLLERASDGSYVLGVATMQLALILVLLPVCAVVGVLIGVFVLFDDTVWGKQICKFFDPWVGGCFKLFANIFTLPSVPGAWSGAESALETGDAVALKEALMRRGFMGLRAVRPRDKLVLLRRALKKSNEPSKLCDAIISAGCRVKGLWPDYDILEWALGYEGSLKKVQWALSHGASPCLNRMDWGPSLINAVLDRGECDILEALVEAYPLGDWAKGRFLKKAADAGASAMLEWMLACPSWTRAANRELICRRGPTLLIRAAWSVECVRILLPRSRANQASYTHFKPALVRLICGRPFLRVGAGACALPNGRKFISPEQTLEVLQVLADAGADMKGKNWGGVTLLHKAARQNSEGCVAWLLNQGLDPLVKDKDGDTPLMWAAKARGEMSIRDLLPVSEIDATNHKGQSALIVLSQARVQDGVLGRERMMTCGEALVSAGANPQLRDNKGLRAVDRAARMANAEIFELLSARSDWDPEAVKRALKTKKVIKMKRPRDVERIRGAADRQTEVCDMEATTPIPSPAVRSRRL